MSVGEAIYNGPLTSANELRANEDNVLFKRDEQRLALQHSVSKIIAEAGSLAEATNGV